MFIVIPPTKQQHQSNKRNKMHRLKQFFMQLHLLTTKNNYAYSNNAQRLYTEVQ